MCYKRTFLYVNSRPPKLGALIKASKLKADFYVELCGLFVNFSLEKCRIVMRHCSSSSAHCRLNLLKGNKAASIKCPAIWSAEYIKFMNTLQNADFFPQDDKNQQAKHNTDYRWHIDYI